MRIWKFGALLLFSVLLSACTAAPIEASSTGSQESITGGQKAQDESGAEASPPAGDGAEDEALQYAVPATHASVPALKTHFDGVMQIGAAVNARDLRESAALYETIVKHYNVLVLENEMKPETIHPREDMYNFAAADTIAQFGEAQDIALRGHTLVWHSQVPAWWFEGSASDGRATREELLARMEDYITTVVGRYKGRIEVWDVVNEAFSDNAGGLRGEEENSLWSAIIGDLDGDGNDADYIEQAFYFARAADPDAQLILNDYNLEGDAAKLEAVYETVKLMLEKGVPIDGVGLQGHINIAWPSVKNFEAAIEKLASLKEYNPDFSVQITELDISVFEWGDESTEKEMDLLLQTQLAARYADLFEMFTRQAEKGNLDMVLTWGIYDGGSWLNHYPIEGRKDAPLLFDRDMRAKPAFWAVIDRDLLPDVFQELR